MSSYSGVTLLLNCDLGEDALINGTPSEELVMPHIDLANVACGFHAGSPVTMTRTVSLAREHGVQIGAHPGYGDRTNFGRISIPHTQQELEALIHYQISALEGMALSQGVTVDYVKPHGALYNDMMDNQEIRVTVMTALARHHSIRKLMLLSTPKNDQHREEALRLGLEVCFEAFADRCYTDNGRLLPRHIAGAVHNQQAMLAQVQQLKETGKITTIGGKTLALEADTLCVHGDHETSVSTILAIRNLIDGQV